LQAKAHRRRVPPRRLLQLRFPLEF